MQTIKPTEVKARLSENRPIIILKSILCAFWLLQRCVLVALQITTSSVELLCFFRLAFFQYFAGPSCRLLFLQVFRWTNGRTELHYLEYTGLASPTKAWIVLVDTIWPAAPVLGRQELRGRVGRTYRLPCVRTTPTACLNGRTSRLRPMLSVTSWHTREYSSTENPLVAQGIYYKCGMPQCVQTSDVARSPVGELKRLENDRLPPCDAINAVQSRSWVLVSSRKFPLTSACMVWTHFCTKTKCVRRIFLLTYPNEGVDCKPSGVVLSPHKNVGGGQSATSTRNLSLAQLSPRGWLSHATAI